MDSDKHEEIRWSLFGICFLVDIGLLWDPDVYRVLSCIL